MSPRRETGRGFFIPESDGGRGAHHSPNEALAARRLDARRRPNLFQVLPARANVPARGLSLREIGFAPEMTARKRSCRAFDLYQHYSSCGAVAPASAMTTLREQAAMTAYLISLALAGLVAIALWEGFS